MGKNNMSSDSILKEKWLAIHLSPYLDLSGSAAHPICRDVVQGHSPAQIRNSLSFTVSLLENLCLDRRPLSFTIKTETQFVLVVHNRLVKMTNVLKNWLLGFIALVPMDRVLLLNCLLPFSYRVSSRLYGAMPLGKGYYIYNREQWCLNFTLFDILCNLLKHIMSKVARCTYQGTALLIALNFSIAEWMARLILKLSYILLECIRSITLPKLYWINIVLSHGETEYWLLFSYLYLCAHPKLLWEWFPCLADGASCAGKNWNNWRIQQRAYQFSVLCLG